MFGLLTLLACDTWAPTAGTGGCRANLAPNEAGGVDGEIYTLRRYTPGKSSFVESTERRKGAWTGPGYRLTLLDVQGEGSIRHIWSTEDVEDPQVSLEFYVDGEEKPSIYGTMKDLVASASTVTACPAPRCAVEHHKAHRDLNLYLPIPFHRSVRIDAVQRTPTVSLFFAQIDYRIDDAHLAGACLRQTGEGPALKLAYDGWSPPTTPAERPRRTLDAPRQRLLPGERRRLFELSGAGVVRQLAIAAPLNDIVWLTVRYDGSESAGLSAPLGDLFSAGETGLIRRVRGNLGEWALPMPYRSGIVVEVENRGSRAARVAGTLEVEDVETFGESWAYLHGAYTAGFVTDGHHAAPLSYIRGEGHWLGLLLYASGHDHGGGDFAVVDGESTKPSFLHGINGEDYFGFAWFETGAHAPYALSRGPGIGRYRLHLENPYPFRRSFQLEWGSFPDKRPRSLSLWYQTSPDHGGLPAGGRNELTDYDIFGPLPLAQGGADPFAKLPSVAALDGGLRQTIEIPEETFESGWMRQHSIGPSLNATYLARHHTEVRGERSLGGNGSVYLARRQIHAPATTRVDVVLSYDDPIRVELGGDVVYEDLGQRQGFHSVSVSLLLKAGQNTLIVRFANTFNTTFNWAGFSLWSPHGWPAPPDTDAR